MHNDHSKQQQAQQHDVSHWSVFKSALAGLLGVQKRENLERDFQSGKFWHFFVAGGVVTILFILVVWLAVKLLLYTSQV